MRDKKFNWRAFTSLYITLSFIIMILSGMILFLAPPGRIANWTDLTILHLTKAQWQAIHTIFTFLFIIASAFHIYFNWKPFTAYLKTKLNKKIRIRRELILSAILTLIIFFLVLINVPPFKMVMDIGENLSNSWSIEKTEPPIPHAELMPLDEFSQTVQIPLEEIITKLKDSEINVSHEKIIIKDLANQNNMSPQELYAIIINNNTNNLVIPKLQGAGYGRMTLQEFCNKNQIRIEDAIIKLNANGIEVSVNSEIRTIAKEKGVRPIELIKIIQN